MAKSDLKLIRHNMGGVDEPDGPSYPYKLEYVCRAPAVMEIATMFLYGGQEIVVIRSKTLPALQKYIKQNKFRSHNRLVSLTITGPEGIIEEVKA